MKDLLNFTRKQGDKMNTVEDFENAPVGATATHPNGSRAMKTDRVGSSWILQNGMYLLDVELETGGYTIDPLEPAPTTAREALDLAWELAHEVREGQVIPEGTRYLEVTRPGLKEYTAVLDFRIRPEFEPIRTVEPLPEPEPDWLDAPAVLARPDEWDRDNLGVFTPTGFHNRWSTAGTDWVFHWSELRDVIPLYPKEEKA